MRFSVDAKTFASAAKSAAAATGRMAHVEALQCTLLTVAGDEVAVTAGDGYTFLRTTVAVTGGVDGSVCVPARLLASAASTFSGDMSVDLDGDTLTIALSDASGEATLRCLDPGGYPRVDWGDGDPVDFVDVWPRLVRIAAAASGDENRPVLTAVRMGGGEGQATDSYRAARCDIPVLETAALVPAGALQRAARTLDADRITVTVSDRTVTFGDGTSRIVTRGVDESFPNLEGVWPTSHDFELEVDGPALAAAVAAVEFVDTTQANAVRLHIVEEGVLGVSRRDSVGGAAATRLVDATGGLPCDVGLNATFLREALQGADGAVQLRFTDEKKPVVVDGVPGVAQILMPVRL